MPYRVGFFVGAVIASTACSYSVTFDDCQVTCAGGESCPTDLTCVSGLCRTAGSTGACGSNVPPGDLTLTQTADTKIDHSLQFGCQNTDSTTPEQSWYRVFSLVTAGVTGTFHIDKITIGINTSVGGAASGSGAGSDGLPRVDVKVGTYAGGATDATLDLSKVTAIKASTIEIPATQITELVDAPLSADIPAGSKLIVEVHNADFKGTARQVVLGATDAAETANAYLRAPFCSATVPTPPSSQAHIVITVTGSH